MTTTEDPLWGHPQVTRLARAGRRLQQFDRNRPWVFDTAVVLLVLLLFALPDLLHDGHRREGVLFGVMPLPAVVALQLALTLPLFWRRRAPEAVLAAVAAVFVLQWSLNVWLHSDIAVFIAFYSVARLGRVARLPWACGAMAAVLLLPALRVSAVVSWLVALFFLYSAATAAAALGLAVRIGRAYLDALRDRAARLEVERDQRSRLAAAAERARVAREMHDIIGHNLSVIIGLADGGAYAAEVAPERSREALTHIGATGRQALDELRRMLGVLSTRPDGGAEPEQAEDPQLSPQPGVADLDALCARVRSAGPEVVYRTLGNPDRLDRGVQLTVYRIVQESLTNTLKHAGPDTRARLTVVAEGTETRVRVEDTGPAAQGPAAPTAPSPDGRGIAGMRERAALYGGTLTAGPRPGGGWAVEAVLEGLDGTGGAG
ncbi:sensor histidine kinase [Streptacidiphilus sp. N1-3]|uniref:histidine kinase n=1 Tax=Streptacidiphilus alkalitolerans TaxID=3342712 RepID=A0ABV6X169_9ACTN